MRRWLVAVTTILALLAAAPGVPAGSASLLAAHRGGALLWPENSLLAFRKALALGVDFLEADVHATADGEVVVLHDPTLDRTTTGRGPVRDARWADLGALRLRDRDGARTDERVPRLAQVLELIRPSRAGLLLEIKVDADRQRYPGIEEKILILVRRQGLGGRVVVMAFEPEIVKRVRALDGSIRTALLVGRGQVERERVSPAESVRRAKDLGAAHLGINHRLVDAEVMAAARKARIRVAAWTVNEEADMRRMIELGVDVLVTDQPDLARRLLGR